MKKFYILFLFINATLFATEIHKFKLNDSQKLESTYSGTFSTSTFHSAVIKNKDAGNYEIITHYVNELQQTVKLDNAIFDYEPSIIAHHQKGDTLTIISHKKDILSIIRYSLKTNAFKTENIAFEKLRNRLSQTDKTILISYQHFRKDFSITEISNAGTRTINLNIDENEVKRYNANFFLENSVAVNTLEFIENGPASDTKCYYEGNYYIVTKDSEYTGITTAMIVDISKGNTAFKNYMNKPFKQKSLTSFVINNHLFSLAGTKDDIIIKSFNLFTGEEGIFMELSNELTSFLPKDVTVEDFVKEAKRMKMKPTIAINKAGENYAVRLDIIDIQSYQYSDYWFQNWMWQQNIDMMMRQNQNNFNSSIPKFGPSPNYYDYYITDYGKTSKYTFTFFLDKNLTILSEKDIETDYANPDKEKYLKPILENKALKDIAPALTDNELRYICLNKITNEVVIAGKKLEKNTTTDEDDAK